jgi:hypothetical protein
VGRGVGLEVGISDTVGVEVVGSGVGLAEMVGEAVPGGLPPT